MASTGDERVRGWIRGMDLCNSLSQAKMRKQKKHKERNATTDRTREVMLPKFDPRYGLAETDEIPVTREIRDERRRSN